MEMKENRYSAFLQHYKISHLAKSIKKKTRKKKHLPNIGSFIHFPYINTLGKLFN